MVAFLNELAETLSDQAAIEAAREADIRVGATEAAQAAARAEERRLAELCDRPRQEWMLAAARALGPGKNLAEQYELTCQKSLPSPLSALPSWAVPAAAAALLLWVGIGR